jgi:hypothetical protein
MIRGSRFDDIFSIYKYLNKKEEFRLLKKELNLLEWLSYKDEIIKSNSIIKSEVLLDFLKNYKLKSPKFFLLELYNYIYFYGFENKKIQISPFIGYSKSDEFSNFFKKLNNFWILNFPLCYIKYHLNINNNQFESGIKLSDLFFVAKEILQNRIRYVIKLFLKISVKPFRIK